MLDNTVTEERWQEALAPKHVAISLSGEPPCTGSFRELVDLFNQNGYTTFLVSNGTNPDVLARCNPYQMYVSLDAPDEETYLSLCRPLENYWDEVQKSLSLLKSRRSAGPDNACERFK